jgi:hypothetical protein
VQNPWEGVNPQGRHHKANCQEGMEGEMVVVVVMEVGEGGAEESSDRW